MAGASGNLPSRGRVSSNLRLRSLYESPSTLFAAGFNPLCIFAAPSARPPCVRAPASNTSRRQDYRRRRHVRRYDERQAVPEGNAKGQGVRDNQRSIRHPTRPRAGADFPENRKRNPRREGRSSSDFRVCVHCESGGRVPSTSSITSNIGCGWCLPRLPVCYNRRRAFRARLGGHS